MPIWLVESHEKNTTPSFKQGRYVTRRDKHWGCQHIVSARKRETAQRERAILCLYQQEQRMKLTCYTTNSTHTHAKSIALAFAQYFPKSHHCATRAHVTFEWHSRTSVPGPPHRRTPDPTTSCRIFPGSGPKIPRPLTTVHHTTTQATAKTTKQQTSKPALVTG
jgi:hypothetical protein